MNQPRTHRSARSKARSRALTVLFESEVRGLALDGTLQQRLDDQDPPVADYTAWDLSLRSPLLAQQCSLR